MTALSNHPGMFLSPRAAASLERYEARYGVLPLNSAGRTEGQQQHAINRWDIGGPANRPPYLYPPYRPAGTAPHVKNGGEAVDTSAIQRFVREGADHGWIQVLPKSDPVHFEYQYYRDKYFGGTLAGSGSGALDIPKEGTDDMIIFNGVSNPDQFYIATWDASRGGRLTVRPTAGVEREMLLASRPRISQVQMTDAKLADMCAQGGYVWDGIVGRTFGLVTFTP